MIQQTLSRSPSILLSAWSSQLVPPQIATSLADLSGRRIDATGGYSLELAQPYDAQSNGEGSNCPGGVRCICYSACEHNQHSSQLRCRHCQHCGDRASPVQAVLQCGTMHAMCTLSLVHDEADFDAACMLKCSRWRSQVP